MHIYCRACKRVWDEELGKRKSCSICIAQFFYLFSFLFRQNNHGWTENVAYFLCYGFHTGCKRPVGWNDYNFKWKNPVRSTFELGSGWFESILGLFGIREARLWNQLQQRIKSFTPGPTMKMKRAMHGCAVVHLGSKTYGIVSGGKYRVVVDRSDFLPKIPNRTEPIKFLPNRSDTEPNRSRFFLLFLKHLFSN